MAITASASVDAEAELVHQLSATKAHDNSSSAVRDRKNSVKTEDWAEHWIRSFRS